jgi:hypothetical protein
LGTDSLTEFHDAVTPIRGIGPSPAYSNGQSQLSSSFIAYRKEVWLEWIYLANWYCGFVLLLPAVQKVQVIHNTSHRSLDIEYFTSWNLNRKPKGQ